MMKSTSQLNSVDSADFQFWLPPEGMTLTIGPDSPDLDVPQIPLPIRTADLTVGQQPSEKAIGDGLYEYLCRFPACDHAADYARILEQAYPFLISDIGSQLILLDVKAVDADGLQRKIALLKILHYLDPDNFGPLHKIGVGYFDLAHNYGELLHVQMYLRDARSWLEKARRSKPTDTANLNYLGQVCYLAGNYNQAKLYWKIAADQLEEGSSREELAQRVERIVAGQLPIEPLVENLEAVGVALEHFAVEEFSQACNIMEDLAGNSSIAVELPSTDFFYFLGLCREKCQNLPGAKDAFARALTIDPEHEPSLDAQKRLATH
ncbi:tetratricopeptide repeat protein [Pelobacter seleniigenes]|uniref:tetratricopeptide repeat protein n=1 Tax=Pelobacter seleniigenes TaxID=407188 RepID=UPI0004A73B12|nr:hypothetical protein [Pelobacter seleniigenes]